MRIAERRGTPRKSFRARLSLSLAGLDQDLQGKWDNPIDVEEGVLA
jgi:hypothetical protein